MRILLTGASGQLGQAFLEEAPMRMEVIRGMHRMGPPSQRAVVVDLERPETFPAALKEARPDWVVHAAGMTAVDACEREPDKAMTINGEATGALAKAASRQGAKFLYVSTDYVFDGRRGHYKEDDGTGPINEYGRSKLVGEEETRRHGKDWVIARTSVVFGPHKKNFVTWLVNELKVAKKVNVVVDQFVTPTLTYDLARQIRALIDADARGVYHTCGADRLSRFEMALTAARTFGLDNTLIQPARSRDLEWLAKRPYDSSMDTGKIAKLSPPMRFAESVELLRKRWMS